MKRVKPESAALPGAEHRTSNIEHPTSNGKAPSGPAFDLEERLLEYSARIIRLVDALHSTRAAGHVGNQILRSGTSPLPNHGEAQAAESLNDFIHKLKICLKELRETHRWLWLIMRVPLISKPAKVSSLIQETDELIRIFVTSLRTIQSRQASDSKVREDSEASINSMFDVGCSPFDVQPPAGPNASQRARYPSKPRRTPRRS
jgi:four helix bundle protein